jgi:MFS superfamily sulfate permease-like transporter
VSSPPVGAPPAHEAPPPAPVRATRFADLLAALSISGLLIPEAVAYAALAGLPPQAGVLALIAGLVCYGLAGNSRFAIVSATSSSAAVLAAATVALGISDPQQRIAMAALLVMIAGIAFAVLAVAKLGGVSNLIARPVLRGYVFGLALVITLKQWPTLVGLRAVSTDFVPLLLEVVRHIDRWNHSSLAVGLSALLLLLLLGRWRRVPATLIVIVGGIAAAVPLAARGVALVGPIELTPTVAAFAIPSARQWPAVIGYAIALMFILFAESWSSIRTYAFRYGDPIQPNRELWALGLSNLVAGLLHGTPVGAGYSGTSANEAAGAQSRRAGLYAAAVVLLLVWAFRAWIERIPQPVLAAVVIHAVHGSLRPAQFQPYMRWRRDGSLALIAAISVLALGVMNGLLVAIGFSLLMLLRGLASPRLSILGRRGEHDFVSQTRFPDAMLVPGILVVRPEEPMFFANAEPLMGLARQAVQEHADTRVLVLSLEESPDLDSTSIESLGELADWLAGRSVELRLARLKDAAHDVLLRAQLPGLPAAALEYASVDDAVRGQRP